MTTAVFDLDGTLYDENTMYAFLTGFLRLRAPTRARWLRWAGARPARAVWRVGRALGAADPYRAVALATLRGVSLEAVQAEAGRYAASLDARAIPRVMALLDTYRVQGARLLLASASLEPVARAVAERLAFDGCVASVPAVRDGVLTGAWADDVRGRKLEALRAAFGALDGLEVVTDNLDDDDLIAAARRAVVVVHPEVASRWRPRLGAGVEAIEVAG